MFTAIERRIDLNRRQRINEMTREEMIRELMTDCLTGVGSKRAFEEWDGKRYVAIVDADSLKWVNDTWGHAAGDALLRCIGSTLKKEGFDIYRLGGDEFAVILSEASEVAKFVVSAESLIRRTQFGWAGSDGHPRHAVGARISIGVGGTSETADRMLLAMKNLRTKIGLRAERGAIPPGLKMIEASTGRVHGFSPVPA